MLFLEQIRLLGDKATCFLLEGEPATMCEGRHTAQTTNCFARALAFLGSEHLGEPSGARAEAKGASFDPHAPMASHYLCLDLERPREKLGGL